MAKYKVALVDDCAQTRLSYKGKLESILDDCEVTTFSSGGQVIQFLEEGKNNIDVFLMKFELGDMQGLEVALKIYEMYRHNKISIMYPSVLMAEEMDSISVNIQDLMKRYKVVCLPKPGESEKDWNKLTEALVEAMESTEQERFNLKVSRQIVEVQKNIEDLKTEVGQGFEKLHEAMSPLNVLKKTATEIYEIVTSTKLKKFKKAAVAVIGAIGAWYSGGVDFIVSIIKAMM